MNWKSITSENGRNVIIGAVGTVLLGLSLLMTPLGHWLAALSYDLPFALRADVHPPEGVIVLMDEDSHRKLNQPPQGPWDRGLHASLMKELTTRGAKTVVFDVLFDQPWPDRSVDDKLAAAFKEHGRVVLAASLQQIESSGRPTVDQVFRATEPLRSAAAGWGVVEVPLETDTTIRRHHYHTNYPSLAWAAATLAGRAPADRTATRWLNFYGPRGAIPHVSYHLALETNALPPDVFSNRVVFVGRGRTITYQGSLSTDDFRTPYTRWTGELSPGVEVLATGTLNFIRGDWWIELPPGVEFLLCVLLGGLAGGGFAVMRPPRAARWAGGGLVVITLAALALAHWGRLWFPWLIVAAVQIPVALVWSALTQAKRLMRQQQELEIALATARLGAHTPLRLKKRPATPAGGGGGSAPTPSSPLKSPVSDSPGQTPGTPANTPPPQIPDHQLFRCIGRGAYGEVWLARDAIGTYHAVKIIHRKTFTSDEPFEREFRGIQRFTPISRSHPGFVHVLHVGINAPAGYFFYIMEAADDTVGETPLNPETYSPKNLAKEIKARGRIPVEECLQISLALTSALDCLHQQGLIHRDIKPSNIIFVNGEPKLADIGLVTQIAGDGSDVTHLGTEGYMAPEGPGTAAADVYSLGKVIYEASMGRNPRQFPEPPTSVLENVGADDFIQLNKIILKACQTDARRRYASAGELQADLLPLLAKLNARRKR